MTIMKKRLPTKKQRTIGLTAILGALAITVVLLCSLMVEQSNQMVQNQTQRYLTEISEQSAYKVNQKVEFNLAVLQSMAENLALLKDQSENIQQNYLNSAVARNSFSWVGFSGFDHILHVEGMDDTDVSSSPAIRSALEGSASISSSLITTPDGRQGIIYAVPLLIDGTVQGVLAGWDSLDSMEVLFSAETFEGQGFSHIVDQNGNFIIRSNNPNALLDSSNFFEALELRTGAPIESLNMVKEDMKAGRTGHLHVVIDQSEVEDLNYIPLARTGWYLISVAPAGVYADSVSGFTHLAIALNVAIFLIFLFLILIIVYLDSRKNTEISRIAYVDPVTGGFTSPRFEIEVEKRLRSSQPFAFLSLDIRKFKLINDTFGSEEGNKVLKYVHDQIKNHLKEGEYVSRISADTFNILLSTTSKEDILNRIQTFAKNINQFNETIDTPYYLPLNCGVYFVTDKKEDIITIRDRANAARKVGKVERSHNEPLFSCIFYSGVERQQLLREKEMENSMERALANEEFVVYLQPKVDLTSNQVVGAEALVRWQTADNGMIPPNDFIPFFEKNGFILKLDLYVFEKVCRILRGWIDNGLKPVPISVNLSRVHLRIPNFLEEFQSIQKKYDIPPELLEIELTETMVFENLDFLKQVIDQIHQMGFQCSMDDFGSGYSSLNVLKDVPVDILKLDKVFFDKNGNDDRGNDVVESVIQLAKKLGMITISEGVETIPQVEFLKQVDCDIVQGYVFSRPVPVEEFEKLIYF